MSYFPTPGLALLLPHSFVKPSTPACLSRAKLYGPKCALLSQTTKLFNQAMEKLGVQFDAAGSDAARLGGSLWRQYRSKAKGSMREHLIPGFPYRRPCPHAGGDPAQQRPWILPAIFF